MKKGGELIYFDNYFHVSENQIHAFFRNVFNFKFIVNLQVCKQILFFFQKYDLIRLIYDHLHLFNVYI